MVWETIKGPIFERVIQLLKAPLENPDMIWMVVPLVITILAMTIYFGRYIREELGWNTALGNSLVLLFISIDLLRYVYNLTSPGSWFNLKIHIIETMVVTGVFLFGLLLLWTNFSHFFPKKIAFLISQPVVINVIAYCELCIVYSKVPVDWITFWSGISLIVVIGVALYIFKYLIHFSLLLLGHGKDKEVDESTEELKEEIEEKKKLLVKKEKQEKEEKKESKEKKAMVKEALIDVFKKEAKLKKGQKPKAKKSKKKSNKSKSKKTKSIKNKSRNPKKKLKKK